MQYENEMLNDVMKQLRDQFSVLEKKKPKEFHDDIVHSQDFQFRYTFAKCLMGDHGYLREEACKIAIEINLDINESGLSDNDIGQAAKEYARFCRIIEDKIKETTEVSDDTVTTILLTNALDIIDFELKYKKN